MSNYKIVKDGKVISVVNSPVWVTQLPNGSIIRCGLADAMGIVSPDSSQTWHIVGAKEFEKSDRKFEDIEAIYIQDTEAEELKTLLDLGASISSNAEVSWEYSPIETEPEVTQDNLTLNEVRERKLDCLFNDSRQAIYSGIDIELSDGRTEHFALGIDEQLDLVTLYSLASVGTERIPFHNASGEWKYYSGDDILSIINAANKLKMYHSAYMDSMRKWISSIQSIAEIGNINYGDTIPEAYRTEVYQDIASIA